MALTEFRSYRRAQLALDDRPVVLTGQNGAGKTNILEALSYLAPGRGLRRARLSEVGFSASGEANSGRSPVNWGVSATITIGDADHNIGTGCQTETGSARDKRIIKIDGEVVKSQAELGRLTAVQWLTPNMDRLFSEGGSGRRRFVDQIIYGLEGDHAGPVNAYDHAQRSRNKLLRDGVRDTTWLDSVEDSMVRHGVAVAVRRLEAVKRLAAHCIVDDGPFPDAIVSMTGELERWLEEGSALDVEDRFRHHLAANRAKDAETGSAGIGPHRSDLLVAHNDIGRPAEMCSTGEQKGLLITLVLAAARMQAEERGAAPLLLLDEVAAHLDNDRRHALFGRISGLGAQAWMTGTDPEMFAAWGDEAQFIRVAEGAATLQS